MRVLVACEASGVVRRAFAARGHDAWSCDLLPAEDRSNKHLVLDGRELLADLEMWLGQGWDLLMVAHPPCTRLCNSGVRWLKSPPPGKTAEQIWAEVNAAADLFSVFWTAPIPRVCIENPIMHKHAKIRIRSYREPAQWIQPWQFGHGEVKRTGLWLRGLPKLEPTQIVDERKPFVHFVRPGPDRWRIRSRTYQGIADAMAEQWGGDVPEERAA